MAYVTTLLASKVSHTPGNGSKAAYTQLIASTAAQYDGLLFVLRFDGARALIDIATGGSGSEAVVIANLPLSGGTGSVTRMFVPLRVAASTRLAIRAQASAAGVSLITSVFGVVGAFTSYATCTTYGADTGTTAGTVVDGGGSANTEGAWVELTSSCGADHDLLLVSVLPPSTAGGAGTNLMADIGTGAAASETAILNDIFWRNSNGSRDAGLLTLPMYPASTVASGTRIAARCQADTTDANGRTAQVIVHAMSSPFSAGASGGGPLVSTSRLVPL